MTAVACLVCLAVGLLAGYALGSSGPCEHDALDETETTLRGGHGGCAVSGNHRAGECRYV